MIVVPRTDLGFRSYSMSTSKTFLKNSVAVGGRNINQRQIKFEIFESWIRASSAGHHRAREGYGTS